MPHVTVQHRLTPNIKLYFQTSNAYIQFTYKIKNSSFCAFFMTKLVPGKLS